MTIDESAKLSPEQLRVAVAERMGKCQYIGVLRMGCRCRNCLDFYQDEKHDSPNYPESRDACAVFTKPPFHTKVTEYHQNLYQLCGGMSGAIEADGTQRCRAFLAVSGNEL